MRRVSEQQEGVQQLAEDVDEIGRKAARTVELGRRGFIISVLVFLLLVGQILPWVGDKTGWEVLVGEGGAIPQLFAATSSVIGIVASALTLATRRWWLTWVCAIGGWFSSVDGLLAVWSQQSTGANNAPGAGPGIGMILALAAIILLAASWMRTAFSRA
jgi:biotin transporter BioY